jgi:hypothetical protein
MQQLNDRLSVNALETSGIVGALRFEGDKIITWLNDENRVPQDPPIDGSLVTIFDFSGKGQVCEAGAVTIAEDKMTCRPFDKVEPESLNQFFIIACALAGAMEQPEFTKRHCGPEARASKSVPAVDEAERLKIDSDVTRGMQKAIAMGQSGIIGDHTHVFWLDPKDHGAMTSLRGEFYADINVFCHGQNGPGMPAACVKLADRPMKFVLDVMNAACATARKQENKTYTNQYCPRFTV